MNSSGRKILIAFSIAAFPFLFIVLKNFLYTRKGFHELYIQHHAIFWGVRMIIAPLVIFYCVKNWREINDSFSLLFIHLSGIAVYCALHWSLSFALSKILLNSPDNRHWNLFNIIKNESVILNLSVYFITVAVFYMMTYYERNIESSKLVNSLEKSLMESRQILLKHSERTHPEPETEKLKKLSIKTGSRTFIIDIPDVIYFQADGPYVKVVLAGKIHLLNQSLQELQKLLPANFLRVHRSSIVNVNFILETRSLQNGDYLLILKNGNEIRASRTYREGLRSIIGKL